MKKYVADSLLHSTTCHIKAYVKNFKILSQAVPEKSLTENVHMHYIGMRDGKKRKIEKEGKINISTLNFLYTIFLATL